MDQAQRRRDDTRRDVVCGGVIENPTKRATTPLSSAPIELMPVDSVVNFGPTDAELMEFAADMEALPE